MYDVTAHQGPPVTAPLYIDVEESSPLNSNGLYSNGLFMKRSASQGHKSHDLHLNMEELSLLRGDLAYDDLDLVSECDVTPVAYSPGRYLQLHDDASDWPDDVTLWPDDVTLWPDDVTIWPVQGQGRPRGRTLSDSLGQTPPAPLVTSRPLKSPRVVLPLLLCVFLAFSMLGGLMTVVT